MIPSSSSSLSSIHASCVRVKLGRGDEGGRDDVSDDMLRGEASLESATGEPTMTGAVACNRTFSPGVSSKSALEDDILLEENVWFVCFMS